MSEIPRLVDQLERALDGDAWHGPPLLAVLRGLDAAAAARRPCAGTHTAWELALHVRCWLDVARRRIAGEAVEPNEAENWPPMPAATDAEWARTVAAVEASYRALIAAAARLDDTALARPVSGQAYDTYVLLHGALQHTLYHAGQIALLGRTAAGR
ncbi:MAG TPA: DinB family protein [Gemmatimonadales bacterium]|nr:DinB family protein [Gemmatimonadales bacterium]